MTRTQHTSFRRAALLAALIPLAGCSIFAIKPASPSPTTRPTTTPTTTPTTRPTTPTTTQPTTRPTTPPTTQPAPTPAGQPPAAQPQTRPAGTPPAGAAATPPAGAAATPPAGAATPPAATPAPVTPPSAAAASAAAISAATAAVKRDSVKIAESQTKRRRSPVYFTMLFDMHSANVRTADGGFLLPEESGSLINLEIALQRARGAGIGIAARMINGSTTQPAYREVALLMGSRRFALDLGAAQRTGFDSLQVDGGGRFDSTYTFPRAGFRSRANLGNTDFSVQLRGLYYIGIPLGDNPVKDELEGWSGETGLSWTWKTFPLTASIGYRIERFKVFAVEQEVSSLSVGAGLLFGRR